MQQITLPFWMVKDQMPDKKKVIDSYVYIYMV